MPLAIFAVMALFALCLAAVAATAGVKPATQSKVRTRTYKGTSSNNLGATMLVKAKVSRRGVPREVTLLEGSGGTMECFLGPTGKTTRLQSTEPWAFDRYGLPLTIQTNDNNKKISEFATEVENGGLPIKASEGEREVFNIYGRFALNGKRANVNFDREFVVKGSTVGSSEELVLCNYHGLFHIRLVGK